MKEQNFEKHARYVPGYHFVTFSLILVVLVGAIVNLVNASPDNRLAAVLLLLVPVVLCLLAWYGRVFALRAQDRAIRAEENFRYFVLTGKRLPSSMRMSQVIALRFAPDEEMVALAERAVTEKLSAKQIKQSILNWKADHHRA